jgi:hypothetical protein
MCPAGLAELVVELESKAPPGLVACKVSGAPAGMDGVGEEPPSEHTSMEQRPSVLAAVGRNKNSCYSRWLSSWWFLAGRFGTPNVNRSENQPADSKKGNSESARMRKVQCRF